MKYCDWCHSYHSRKARHIARHLYLLALPLARHVSKRQEMHLLFKTRAQAKRKSYMGDLILKVEVRPL